MATHYQYLIHKSTYEQEHQGAEIPSGPTINKEPVGCTLEQLQLKAMATFGTICNGDFGGGSGKGPGPSKSSNKM